MNHLILSLLASFLTATPALAASPSPGPLFTYEGLLTDTNGTPITTTQSVLLQIIYPSSCVLFSETHTISPGSSGEFSVIVGSGTRGDSTGNTADRIFGSNGTVNCEGGGTQALSGFTTRSLRVRVGGTDLTPDVAINTVPFAINAARLSDKAATDFVQVSPAITQTNVESVFNRFTALDSILNLFSTPPSSGQILIGNGSSYSPANITAGAGISITNGAGSITIAATGGGGTITGITAAAPLSVGGTAAVPEVVLPQAGIATPGYLSSTDWNIFNNKMDSNLSSGMIFVGNGSNVATPVSVSGDATLSSGGALTLNNTGTAGTYFKVTTDAKGRVTAGDATLLAADVPVLDWSKITTGKPASLSGYGILDGIKNLGGTPGIQSGLSASRPAPSVAGRIYISTDTNEIYQDSGSAWNSLGSNGGVATDLASMVTTGIVQRTGAGSYSAVTINNPLNYSAGTLGVNVGTSAGSVAAGDDARIVGALQQSGGTLTGALNMGSNDLTSTGYVLMSPQRALGLGTYTNAQEASFIGGLSAGHKGYTWFNSDSLQMRYWDGSGAQSLGVSGAGLTSLNGQTSSTQSFAIGLTGTTPTWSSSSSVHNLTIPMASTAGAVAGLITKTEFDSFAAKQPAGNYVTALTGDVTAAGPGSAAATIAINAVTSAKIANGTIVAGDLDFTGVNTATTSFSMVDGSGKFYNFACATTGHVPTWTAGGFTCQTPTPLLPALNDGKIWIGDGANAAMAHMITGDASLSNTGVLTLANSGVAPGTYSKLTVDIKGRVTVGANIAAGDVTSALGFTPFNKAGDVMTGPLGLSGVATDPAGLTAADKGKMWYRTDLNEIKYWNGSASISLGTAGSGLTSLNGLTTGAQTLVTGSAGTDFNIDSSGAIHTFNIPSASATNRGLLTSTDWSNFNSKFSASVVTPAAGHVIRYNGSTWVNGLINAATDIGGTISVMNGGTGTTSLTPGNILVGAGTAAMSSLAAGSAGNVIYATGINSWDSGSPDMAGLVDKNSTQTISGAKAFTNYIQMAAQNQIKLADADSSDYVGLRSPATIATSFTLTMPNSTGTNGQVMTTDGSGNLGWTTPMMELPAIAGSPSSPAYSFTGDTNTGMFGVSPDVIGFSTSGTERVRIDVNGRVGIGNSTPSSPLSVYGGAGGEVANFTVPGSGNISIGSNSNSSYLSLNFKKANLTRWSLYNNNTSETGASEGSDLSLLRHDDTGASLGPMMSWDRSTGYASLGSVMPQAIGLLNGLSPIPSTRVFEITGGGSGATPTTYSNGALLLTNNNGAEANLDELGSIQFGHKNGSYGLYAKIRSDADGSVAGNRGGSLIFMTKTDGGSGTTTRMKITPSGDVGIGTTTPLTRLHVVGDVTIAGSGSITNAWTVTSDLRFKDNIQPLHGALEKILALRGVSYDWKNEEFPERHLSKGHDIGVIAQEVEAVFPEAVATDAEGYKSVAYTKLVSPLIESTRELYGLCKASEEQLQGISRRVASLEDDAAAKEARIKALEEENKNLKRDLELIKAKLGL